MSSRTRYILELAKQQNNTPAVIAVVEETDMYLTNIPTSTRLAAASVNEKNQSCNELEPEKRLNASHDPLNQILEIMDEDNIISYQNQDTGDGGIDISENPDQENVPNNFENDLPQQQLVEEPIKSNSLNHNDDTSSTSSSSSSSSSESYDGTSGDPNYSSQSCEAESEAEDEPAPQGNKKRSVKNPCPPPQKKVRKRKRAPDQWHRNVSKKLRNSGLPYTSMKVTKNRDGTKEKVLVNREAKHMLPVCNTEKCRLKCSTKISEAQRQIIFDEYWAMADLQKQRLFIASCLTTIKPRYRYLNATTTFRGLNNAYHFKLENESIRVCKQFFMATLSINSRIIRTVIEKQNDKVTGVLKPENRGKHGNNIKISEEMKNCVRDHIQGIPRKESHYCRSGTDREYVEGGKTIADLHRDYVESCKALDTPYVNYIMYFNIFKEEFNISFHVPKKDQCDFCNGFYNSTEEEKISLQNQYDSHMEEKKLSRQEKDEDKKSEDKVVAVFDLQAALPCPQGESSSFYYVSKLNVYNLTIYELKTGETYCFTWHEGHANRGANEIGSCLWNYLVDLDQKSLDKKIDIVFYSDNCAGQNKNRFIFALYIYAVYNLPNINSITHKFLVTGHTQNEGDHVHSVIESLIKRFKKSSPIHVPDQYVSLIRQAKKRGTPYKIREMSYQDFYDLKLMAQDIGIKDNLFKNQGNDNEVVQLSNLSVVKFIKDNPEKLFYKTSFTQDYFRSVAFSKNRRQTWPIKRNPTLKPAYKKKAGISTKKKESLLTLFAKKKNGTTVMPQYYKDFYENL